MHKVNILLTKLQFQPRMCCVFKHCWMYSMLVLDVGEVTGTFEHRVARIISDNRFIGNANMMPDNHNCSRSHNCSFLMSCDKFIL